MADRGPQRGDAGGGADRRGVLPLVPREGRIPVPEGPEGAADGRRRRPAGGRGGGARRRAERRVGDDVALPLHAAGADRRVSGLHHLHSYGDQQRPRPGHLRPGRRRPPPRELLQVAAEVRRRRQELGEDQELHAGFRVLQIRRRFEERRRLQAD